MRERVRSVYESVREIKCVSLRNREREYVCVCVRERNRESVREKVCVRVYERECECV